MHQMCQTVETIVGICDLCLGLGRVSGSPLNDCVCLFSRILRFRLLTFHFSLWNTAVKSLNIPPVVPWTVGLPNLNPA